MAQNVVAMNQNEMPALLQVLIAQAPHLFGNKASFDNADAAITGKVLCKTIV